jgi:RNA polymerase sigma-70 factor (ECF subfamily)
VRNACIDILRKSRLVEDIESSDLENIITDDEAKSRSEKEARLWTAIDNLPEKCRKIFLMSKRDGMKYREIAEELCISEKTVEHQISKALKRLQGSRDEILFVMFTIF